MRSRNPPPSIVYSRFALSSILHPLFSILAQLGYRLLVNLQSVSPRMIRIEFSVGERPEGGGIHRKRLTIERACAGD